MADRTAPDPGSSWIPEDAIADALRSLTEDLRTRLAGQATIHISPPVLDGPGGRDGPEDAVAVTPGAAGAVPLWWVQHPREIAFGVDASERWVLPRDDHGVAVLEDVVAAVLSGRVEVGRGIRVRTCRVHLRDGTVIDDCLRLPWSDGLDHVGRPISWTWAQPYLPGDGRV